MALSRLWEFTVVCLRSWNYWDSTISYPGCLELPTYSRMACSFSTSRVQALQRCASTSSLWSAEDPTQGFVPTRQVLDQLCYILVLNMSNLYNFLKLNLIFHNFIYTYKILYNEFWFLPPKIRLLKGVFQLNARVKGQISLCPKWNH